MAKVKDHRQLCGRIVGVPQCFFKLLPQWLAIEASFFQDCTESFPGAVLQIQIQEVFKFYAKGRCQGWLSKHLDEGGCSDGLLLLHPQLSVELWGSYGKA